MSTLPIIPVNQNPLPWDWKASYVERFYSGEGYEMFSEESVTPDTSLILAGPPRISDDSSEVRLRPIGLVNNLSFSGDVQLQPLREIGTDYTFFTRGKTMYTMQIGAMVANKSSLMKILSVYSPQSAAKQDFKEDSGDLWLNLDSSRSARPFGLMIVFKTRGGPSDGMNGEMLSYMYAENCNIANFSINVSSQDVVVQENVTVMFDRLRPVDTSQ